MTTSSAYREAFLAGERAFWNGVKRGDCPHGPATHERDYWRDGWDLGHTDSEDEAKSVCEKAFQNGGPRVYLQHGGLHSRTITPSPHSARRTLELADNKDIVWHRFGHAGAYVWHATHKVVV